MTSAVATSLVVPASVSPSSTYGCRASFGRDAAEEEPSASASASASSSSPARAVVATPAISKDFIDFEFSFGGCTASMLPADELFADGKLLPLRKDVALATAQSAPEPDVAAAATIPPARRLLEAAMPAPAEPMRPIRGGAAAGAADQYVFSPKAPSCSSRWRELLGLKRAAAQSPKASSSSSPSPALSKTPGSRMPTNSSTTGGSSAARSLKFLLQRSNGGRGSDLACAPLLRDSSDSEASLSLASSRFSHSSSSSSSAHDHDDLLLVANPRFSLDSAAPDHSNNPPRLRLVHHRHSTSSRAPRTPPPPPPAVTADSPRMNSSGKIVFQTTGLERSCSSPCSLHAAAARSRSMARAVDRSYSSGLVRAAPVVLNVPVCSRPVFGGFFKDKTKEAAANKDSAAASARSSSRSSTLGRKAAPQPQRWSGELPKLNRG